MSDQHENVNKKRVSVTMTTPYVEALDSLVSEGIYLSRGEAVLEGLRIIFRRHGLKPFGFIEGPSGKGGEGAGEASEGS